MTQVNEFYNLSNFVDKTPDITMQGVEMPDIDQATADAMAMAGMPSVAPVTPPAPPPPMRVTVYYRDMYTSPDSWDATCDQFKMDISFIVTVSDENDVALESGVVTKRVILSKQCLAQELACNEPVTEELNLTKQVVEAAKEVKKELTESSSHEATLKRMRELAGIPHKSNRV